MTFDAQFESLNDISMEFRVNKQAIFLGRPTGSKWNVSILHKRLVLEAVYWQ